MTWLTNVYNLFKKKSRRESRESTTTQKGKTNNNHDKGNVNFEKSKNIQKQNNLSNVNSKLIPSSISPTPPKKKFMFYYCKPKTERSILKKPHNKNNSRPVPLRVAEDKPKLNQKINHGYLSRKRMAEEEVQQGIQGSRRTKKEVIEDCMTKLIDGMQSMQQGIQGIQASIYATSISTVAACSQLVTTATILVEEDEAKLKAELNEERMKVERLKAYIVANGLGLPEEFAEPTQEPAAQDVIEGEGEVVEPVIEVEEQAETPATAAKLAKPCCNTS